MPVPLLLSVAVPLGVTAVPESVSTTLAVQVVAELRLTDVGLQLTVVDVVRFPTVNVSAFEVALPPPLPGFVTVTLCDPSVLAEALIVNVTVMLVLLLMVGVPAVTPVPLTATVLPETKFVPVSVSVTDAFKSPEGEDMLVSVGAVAAVAYVPVNVPLFTLLPVPVASMQIVLLELGELIGVLLPKFATISFERPVQLQFWNAPPWSDNAGAWSSTDDGFPTPRFPLFPC